MLNITIVSKKRKRNKFYAFLSLSSPTTELSCKQRQVNKTGLGIQKREQTRGRKLERPEQNILKEISKFVALKGCRHLLKG